VIPAAVWQAFCLACPGEDYDGEPLLWRRDAPGKRTRRVILCYLPENPARRPIHQMQLGARKAGDGLVAVLIHRHFSTDQPWTSWPVVGQRKMNPAIGK
jgi:hypothetical protein